MSCLLLPFLFGLTSALLGGWIIWEYLKNRITLLNGEKTKLGSRYAKLESTYADLNSQYNTYKGKTEKRIKRLGSKESIHYC